MLRVLDGQRGDRGVATIVAGVMRRGLVVSFVPLLLSSPARGQTPAPVPGPPPRHTHTEPIVMRLDFAGVPGCSDPEPFVLMLNRRVHGWDPLAPSGRWRLVLTVEEEARKYKGTAQLHKPDGAVDWTRSFPPKDRCFDLLDRLSLATAIHIDPLDSPPAPAPPPKPPEPEMPKLAPVSPEPVKPGPVELPARARFAPRLGLGARVDFGGAWGALFEVTVEGGFQRREWRWGGWSLMGGFRWAPQQTGIGPPSTIPTVDVSSALAAGSVTGCVYRAWPVTLAGCVVTELGEVQQSAGTSKPPNLHQTVLFAGGGVSARIEVPLSALVYVQVAADVRGIANLAGSTSQWSDFIERRFGGATGGLAAGVGFSF